MFCALLLRQSDRVVHMLAAAAGPAPPRPHAHAPLAPPASYRSANDEGLRLLATGQASEAFDAFTEAIRLHPTSPVYHSNRAAVGLKLGRAELAAEDAVNALQRDPTYLKACLRGGRAQLGLRQPEEARGLFQRALELAPGSSAAARGLAEAEAMLEAQQRERREEAAAAAAGARPGMPRRAVPEAEAAEHLYAAAQMLAANPGLQAARAGHVEGLILCRRFAEAAGECEGLLPGPDRQYLEAEVAWRCGDLPAALGTLAAALAAAPGNPKCAELQRWLEPLGALWQEAAAAREDGALGRCAECCTVVLERLEAPACMGLHCAVLHLRAEAQAARGLWGEALRDLDTALAGDPHHAACLQLRAEVHRHQGRHIDSMLDLQRLEKVAPATPGLFKLMEQAARLCLGGKQQQHARRAGFGGGGDGSSGVGSEEGGGGQDALGVLGLGPDASSVQIRQAYLKLAAKWHPDKWAGAAEGEREAAEARFKVIQRVYELLTE